MKNNYLVNNIFENDLLLRQMEKNPELVLQQIERLKIENNQFQQQATFATMAKQLNDLHTIAMSSTVPKIKEVKTKKSTKKDRLNAILAKRALDSAIKNS